MQDFLENERKRKKDEGEGEDSDLLRLSLSSKGEDSDLLRLSLSSEGEDSDLLRLSLSSNRQVKPKQQINISSLLPSTSLDLNPLAFTSLDLNQLVSTSLDLNPSPGVTDVDLNIGAQRTSSAGSASLDLNLNPVVADMNINIGSQRQRISSGATLLMSSTDLNQNLGVADVDVNMGIKRNTFRSGSRRSRRSPSQGPAQGKSETIPPPFPWATDRRAYVHSRNHLVQNNILSITGKVQCKRCENKFEMTFNLNEKLRELCIFIQKNRGAMHDRAPKAWVDPVLPKCEYCGQENSVRPFLANTKKMEINWLFLLLGQMLGCCTLDQLKYFCKHTQNHRTGAKDRVLYSTYMGLCQQLIPDGVI